MPCPNCSAQMNVVVNLPAAKFLWCAICGALRDVDMNRDYVPERAQERGPENRKEDVA